MVSQAEVTIEALLGSDTGKQKSLTALAMTSKYPKKHLSKQNKEVIKAVKTASKVVNTGTKELLKTERSNAKSYKSGLRSTTRNKVIDNTVTPYPTVARSTFSTTQFDYKAVTDNYETTTVIMTRVSDSATSSCVLEPAY